eukprot:TRINITY_DN8430_c0_g1_i1.p1 TRINITY_DN8430_c0_g1~~TRINITY_DN8430_c0_g1_i1.p1  ORF type:complete len:969 (+),score=147.36 TRINITY_DN8430_c0_g1_i1:44-2950(+)
MGLLRKLFVGNVAAGPLLYDQFLATNSLQLYAPYDREEKERLDKLDFDEQRIISKLRWIMDPVIGVACGIAAVLLRLLTEFFFDLRVNMITRFMVPAGGTVSETCSCLLIAVSLAVIMSLVAGAGVAWQPKAASSGIPAVIAFLNGCDVRASLGPNVLSVKLVGTALACGAGLAVGPEGPMIHIGTMVGMLSLRYGVRPALRVIGGDAGRRFDSELAREPVSYTFQAAAMGAGAGLAAAFSAPLAGTVFVVEEAASYFSKRLFLHTFITCGIAVFTKEFFNWVVGSADPVMFVPKSGCSNEGFMSFVLMLQCCQVGIVCGVLAAGFNRVVVRMNAWRVKQGRRLGTTWAVRRHRWCEVAVIAMATALFSIIVPLTQPCQDASMQVVMKHASNCLPTDWMLQIVVGMRSTKALGSEYIPAPGLFGVQFDPENCPVAVKSHPACRLPQLSDKYCCGFDDLTALKNGNFYNVSNPVAPLKLDPETWQSAGCHATRYDVDNKVNVPQFSPSATMSLSSPRLVVRSLFTRGSREVLPTADLAIFGSGYLILAAISSGAWVPSGLVLPMMIIGGTVGRLSAAVWLQCLGSSSETTVFSWIPEWLPLFEELHIKDYYQASPDAGVLAILGAAAFLAGSGSLTLFVVVLIIELTLDPALIPFFIIAVSTARFAAKLLGAKGLYHTLLEVQCLPFLDDHAHWRQQHWVVADILAEDRRRELYFASHGGNWQEETNVRLGRTGMVNSHIDAAMSTSESGRSSTGDSVAVEVSSDGGVEGNAATLIFVQRLATIAEVRGALDRCLPGDTMPVANGFPVVEESGVYCGLVTRRALERLLDHSAQPTSVALMSMNHNSLLGSEGASLAPPAAASTSMSAGGFNNSSVVAPNMIVVDVGAVMDRGAIVVGAMTPVRRAHMLFRQLGLRHVVVTNQSNQPIGILTRKSLMPWRAPWRGQNSDNDTFLDTRQAHSPRITNLPRS